MDPMVLIVLALWCGVPNLPMASKTKNQEIVQCRNKIMDCIDKYDNTWHTSTIPQECLK
jgi:hypothetical protein